MSSFRMNSIINDNIIINKSQVGLNNILNLKENTTALTIPTVNNDSLQGYSIGSRWIDTVAQKDYVCTNAAVGAAVWKETTLAGGGGGTVNSASNVGSGAGVFKTLASNNLEFKSLTPTTTKISLSSNTNDIGIDVVENQINYNNLLNRPNQDLNTTSDVQHNSITIGTGATNYILPNSRGTINQILKTNASGVVSWANDVSTGEVNTISSVGAGTSLVKGKTGVDLQVKSLVGDTGFTITQQGTDEVKISYTETGQSNTITSVGAGTSLVKGKTGVDLQVKSLVGDTGFTITQQGTDEVKISYSETGQSNTISSVGAGTSLVKGKTGLDLQVKSLVAGSNITLTPQGTDEVKIDASTASGSINHNQTGTVDSVVLSGDKVYKHFIEKPQADVTDNSYSCGNSSLSAITSGASNVVIGNECLNTLSTSGFNTAISKRALQNVTGEHNIGIGYQAGRAVASSSSNANIAIGRNTLSSMTGAARGNVCIGVDNTGNGAGQLISSGNDNVCIGSSSGIALTSGSNNTCIGNSSNCSATLNNQTAIGSGALCDTTNQIVLGNASVTQIKTMNNNLCDLGSATARLKDIHSNTIRAHDYHSGTVAGATGKYYNNPTDQKGIEVAAGSAGNLTFNGSTYTSAAANSFLAVTPSTGAVTVGQPVVNTTTISTNNQITRFHNATGKDVKNSLATIDDTGNISTMGNMNSGNLYLNQSGAPIASELPRIQSTYDLTAGAITNGLNLSTITTEAKDTNGTAIASKIQTSATSTWTGGNRSTQLKIQTIKDNDGSLTDALILKSNSTMSIPTKTTTGDPAGTVEGDIWYNSTDNKFRVNEGGTIKDWVATVGGSGDVVGPSSSNDNEIALFSLGTGKLLKASNMTISGQSISSASSITLNATTNISLQPGGSNNINIGGSIIPSTHNTFDMGSSASRLRDGFLQGTLRLGATGTDYTMPTARGTNLQVLQTNATGAVGWSTLPTGGDVSSSITDNINGELAIFGVEATGKTISKGGVAMLRNASDLPAGLDLTRVKTAGFVQNGDILASVGFRGSDPTLRTCSSISSVASATWDGTNTPTNLQLEASKNAGINVDWLSINSNGTLTIPRTNQAGAPAGVSAGSIWYDTLNNLFKCYEGSTTKKILTNYVWQFACSDEITPLTLGQKISLFPPFSITVLNLGTAVRATLTTASTSGNVIIDIRKGASSIFTTPLQIDVNHKRSELSGTPYVFSGTAALRDWALTDEITVHIITSAGTGATGLKLQIHANIN